MALLFFLLSSPREGIFPRGAPKNGLLRGRGACQILCLSIETFESSREKKYILTNIGKLQITPEMNLVFTTVSFRLVQNEFLSKRTASEPASQ